MRMNGEDTFQIKFGWIRGLLVNTSDGAEFEERNFDEAVLNDPHNHHP